jgi:ADP-ribosylglycohydrolase
MSSSPVDSRERIRRSALWAAFGDALGFIAEGANASALRRRAGTDRLVQTVPWKRKIGRFGPSLELPAGCISDDTQLRLATCRSIRGRGEFDVETFAKIELTVWPAYALGAGIGSQAAAANLRRRDITWATNFFATERSDYLNGGGNGAAMRVQPHVWAHPPDAAATPLIAAVIQNAVATHGHPRGILGAVFHARCLQYALERGEAPGPDAWDAIAGELRGLDKLVQDDPRLSEVWHGQWEQRAGTSFAAASAAVAEEIRADLELCARLDLTAGGDSYLRAMDELDARLPHQRGSGTKTAILAALLGRLFPGDPDGAVVTAANCLDSDTDTIATMAGAIVGAVADREPDGPIADRDYIAHEADRMWAIGAGGNIGSFRYPSLVRWTAPKSASDCVGTTREGDGMELAGLGRGRPSSDGAEGTDRAHSVWQWLDLWFGQRILAKRRPHPHVLPKFQIVSPTQQYLQPPTQASESRFGNSSPPAHPKQVSIEDLGVPIHVVQVNDLEKPLTVHELTKEAISSGFDPTLVGRLLLELADRDDGIEAAIAFAAIIAKARISRRANPPKPSS